MIKEDEENEKVLLCAKIFLLILEIIIVGILAFIFFGVSQVNAQTLNYQTYNTVDSNDYAYNWGTSYTWHTMNGNIKRFEYVWGNINSGYYEGHITLDLDYTGYYNITKNNIQVQCRGTSSVLNCANNIEFSKNANQSRSLYDIDIYFNGTLDSTQYFQVRIIFDSNYYPPTGIKFRGSGSIDWSQTDNATNTTINNATSQIIINNNNNTDRMIDHMILFHEADEEEWEEEKGLLQSILSAIGGIFSSSIDDPSNTLNGFNNSIASNGTITSLLLLPVTIYQKVINSINATCVDFTLGTLWNTTLTMSCLHIDGIIGNALYGTIDVIISGFFILAIRKRFISIFNNLSSLKTGGNELE